MQTVRVWDLPIRLFHWSLVLCVIGLVVSGNIGGGAMTWHLRFGQAVLSLLLFRIVWGLVGGHWSRFSSFIYSPKTLMAFLRGERKPEWTIGHNPLGALSVFALLGFLFLQVGTGLMSDDDIATTGPLSSLVSGATVKLATRYHTTVGKTVLIVLVLLHIGAIAFYWHRKKENLVRPMIAGDKTVQSSPAAPAITPSRDSAASRIVAALLFAASVAFSFWVFSLGG